jgi:hypothetical protein
MYYLWEKRMCNFAVFWGSFVDPLTGHGESMRRIIFGGLGAKIDFLGVV